MAANQSDDNFFVAILKFLLFLVIFYFAAGFTYQFAMAVQGAADIDILILPGTVFFTFGYYLFIKDLNEMYKKIQTFLFRNHVLACLVPFLLIVAAITYFVLIRFFSVPINRSVFVFVGGFIVSSHLIFVSHETRGESFGQFAGYLFNFSLYYLVNVALLAAYFNIVFNFNVLRVFLDGLSSSIAVVRSFF